VGAIEWWRRADGSSRPRFRHDKVVDFFLKLAFDDDPSLQVAHFDDPRFRGVYLLYAQTAAIDLARRCCAATSSSCALRRRAITRSATNSSGDYRCAIPTPSS
jgi:hypothetical protein